MPSAELTDDDFQDGCIDLISMLVQSGLVGSRSEGRRAIEQGGVSVDGEKVTDMNHQVSKEDFRRRWYRAETRQEEIPKGVREIQEETTMEKYGVNQLRQMFLEFIESKGHLAMKSFSLVPHDDKSFC